MHPSHQRPDPSSAGSGLIDSLEAELQVDMLRPLALDPDT